MSHPSERVQSRLKSSPSSLPTSPVPRPSPQGTPAALPSPLLRRLSSTSARRAAPCYAWLRAAPAGDGGGAKRPLKFPIRRSGAVRGFCVLQARSVVARDAGHGHGTWAPGARARKRGAAMRYQVTTPLTPRKTLAQALAGFGPSGRQQQRLTLLGLGAAVPPMAGTARRRRAGRRSWRRAGQGLTRVDHRGVP